MVKERDSNSIQQRGYRSPELLTRRTLDSLFEGCQIIGRDWKYLYVNEAAARHGHSTREQLLGRTMLEAFPGIAKTAMFSLLEKCMNERIPQGLENEFEYSDGTKGWFDLKFEPVPEGVFIFSIDISQRRRAEERLRVIDERLEAIVQASPAAIFSLDVLGNVVSWNRAAEQIFGWTAQEAIGRPLPAVQYEKSEEHSALKQRVLSGESFSNVEVRRVRKDGSPVTLNLSTAPLRDRNGAITGIMAVALDIGERLRLESRARSSEERYRELVENLEDVVFSLDDRSAFTYVSPAIGKFGYDRGEFIGRPFNQFVHPDDLPTLQRSFERTASGAIEPFEFRVFDKQGAIRHVLTSSRAIMKNGRLIGINGIIADVTEQRQMQEQFRLAQRMESIGRLAGGVAHDFNNLLTVINNFAVLVDESLPEADPLRGYLGEIIKAGERAAGLTRQLLAFSRKQVLMPKVINLNLVIADMEKMLRRLIGEDIELVTVPAGDLGNVKADPGQLEQVIMNLAINSRDAMPQGGRLSIETANVELDGEYARQHVEAQPGPHVMLTLSDNGCGMDAPTKARLFEPFFTTKGPGKGTGLGLATVYGIVKQSGGNIWIYSEPGQGTVVKIYLPREHAAIEAKEEAQPEVSGSLISETILVVEDDNSLRNLIVQILETVGYKVLAAANGVEALNVCEQRGGSIDLMLTDVIMPQMSGKELAGRVAAAYPSLRLLFMSGYTDDAIMHHGVLEPGTEFISKPFSAKELRRKVRRVLDHEPPTPPPRLRA